MILRKKETPNKSRRTIYGLPGTYAMDATVVNIFDDLWSQG